MRVSFLMTLNNISFFIITLLCAPLTHATSPPQYLSLFHEISDPADSSTLDLYSAVTTVSETQNTTLPYDLVQELRTLPVGKKYDYYFQVLEQRGYIVMSNYNDNQHWDFALRKMDQNLRLTITYNMRTGKSITLTASGPRFAHVRSYRSGQE